MFESGSHLKLKPIDELLRETFFIPAYQRGYRWSKRQVIELLEDIKEFRQSSLKDPSKSFYCLQPIVVKKRGDTWELVDGQQRLTTIFIIMTSLKKFIDMMEKSRYQLSYETRPESADFLDRIDESRADENIDFYHIVEAKRTVDTWFKEQDGTYGYKFAETLLNPEDDEKNVQVIWYEINETEDAIEVFTRLNMGKIPLANAELVKALFLKSTNFSNQASRHLQQLTIAQEWDSIESRLQNDAFWFFLSNKAMEANRIELVLDLASRNLDSQGIGADDLKVFLKFNRLFNETTDIKINVVEQWRKIKHCFMTLEEWFNDKELYHLIGFLIAQNYSIEKLFEINDRCHTKIEFRTALRKRIYTELFTGASFEQKSFKFIEEQLAKLDYESNSDARAIRKILLFFNIASLLCNPTTNARFQFDKFKQEDWDIEHIRSVASDILNANTKKQIAWLNEIKSYISDEMPTETANSGISSKENKKILKSINRFFDGAFDYNKFVAIYDEIIQVFDPENDSKKEDTAKEYSVDNSIGNLTLLDKSTNRSYKNSLFPIKRQRIIKLDKLATFVPLCTKNVFLKYYSTRADRLIFWEQKDSQQYQDAIARVLFELFDVKEIN